MKCLGCGWYLRDSDIECPECGKPVPHKVSVKEGLAMLKKAIYEAPSPQKKPRKQSK